MQVSPKRAQVWSDGRIAGEGFHRWNRRFSYGHVQQYENVYSPFERGSFETRRSGYSVQSARKRNSQGAFCSTAAKRIFHGGTVYNLEV